MKTLFVLLDGAGDERIKSLGNKTPLEKAKMPNLDSIVSSSKTGLMNVIRKDIAPESDQALFTLFGYDPFKLFPGRGVIEAISAGIEFNEGDLLLRGNFCLSENGIIKNTDVPMSTKRCGEICKEINKNLKGAEMFPSMEFRFVLKIKGPLSDSIQNTHPGYDVIEGHVSTATRNRNGAKSRKCIPLGKDSLSLKTAERVNDTVDSIRKILKGRFEANDVILRGAGCRKPKMERMKDKWAVFAESPADGGIAKLIGAEVMKNPKDIVRAVEKALEKYDNVYVQFKGPDSFSHKMDPSGKVKELERIDREFFGRVGKGVRFVITTDHCTSSMSGEHLSNPVPISISSLKPDDVGKLDEESCKRGSLGMIEGKNLMRLLG